MGIPRRCPHLSPSDGCRGKVLLRSSRDLSSCAAGLADLMWPCCGYADLQETLTHKTRCVSCRTALAQCLHAGMDTASPESSVSNTTDNESLPQPWLARPVGRHDVAWVAAGLPEDPHLVGSCAAAAVTRRPAVLLDPCGWSATWLRVSHRDDNLLVPSNSISTL